MKHYTDEDIAAFLDDGKHSHPIEWFFARDFWESRTKGGLKPDESNPHYVGLNRCWGWNGRILGGYGVIQRFNKTKGAHRVSYEIHHGPIPDGMMIMHKCDNKICTNPEHLEAGTSRQNVKDAHTRGLVKMGKSKSTWAKADKLPYLVIGSVINRLDKRLPSIMGGEEQDRLEAMWGFQNELKELLRDCFAMAYTDRKFLHPKQAKKRIQGLDASPTEDMPCHLFYNWIQEIDEERNY